MATAGRITRVDEYTSADDPSVVTYRVYTEPYPPDGSYKTTVYTDAASPTASDQIAIISEDTDFELI
jgi:hypothetical protein